MLGVTDYGVLQKGDSKPFKLAYFPKTVVGNANAKPIGEKLRWKWSPRKAEAERYASRC